MLLITTIFISPIISTPAVAFTVGLLISFLVFKVVGNIYDKANPESFKKYISNLDDFDPAQHYKEEKLEQSEHNKIPNTMIDESTIESQAKECSKSK